ncbi:traB domain-containing protein isoform X2 [Lingula anatina]|uniref:TraB domain-containing protein isoform X2 n=1 Tax=Lingula anatina TaxID=7574 RepID=A0A1S3IAE6_LINAN|nr:traB domain-containing protein isoform X2 [Lingula anatina]|eukprot:XP_013395138.1 traB domain-containing protein isoform X2 [Lingula anatina]
MQSPLNKLTSAGNMDRISNAGRLNKLTVAPPPGLPDRLVVLQAEDGSLVYLVGTWHFTKESIDDVVKTIQAVQPDKVVVELCTDALKLRFGKVQIFKQNEMKVAIAEARKVPGTCEVCLGDLPLHIIRNHFRAAVEELSTWDIFLFYLATRTIVKKLYSTKKSHVDRQKTWNALVEEQQIWRERFPGGYKVIMEERDVYLTHSLKMAAQALPHPKETGRMKPAVVVGVVGLGHLPGIVDNWNKELDPEAVTKTYLISDRLRNIKCVALLVKMTFIGTFVYVSYKVTHSLFGAKRLVVFLSLLGLGYYGTKEVLGEYWLSRKH